jgi:hypothetical protein
MSLQMMGYAVGALLSLMVVCAVGPAVLFMVNLRRYRAPMSGGIEGARVAVLIPARDEERNIAACVEAVLLSAGVELEVLVLNDGSTDHTSEIVSAIAKQDRRVRLLRGVELRKGGNGKQHACWTLAQATGAPILVFLDADVRVGPRLLARCSAEMERSGVALLSGFPRQIVVGWMEKMLLPLIHFVLLGFLPMGRMRSTTDPVYAAGCGQFMMIEREAYFRSGGHGGIRETRHDGLKLPQLLRRHGHRTELVDLTELAQVRMYETAGQVWMGLAKNATEGLAAPGRIVPLTLLLLVGQVLPTIAALLWGAFLVSNWVVGATFDDPAMAMWVTVAVGVALVGSYLPRLLAVRRFRQPWSSAVLHPLGIVMLLVVQWYALGKQVLGRPVSWRARSYASASGEEVEVSTQSVSGTNER